MAVPRCILYTVHAFPYLIYLAASRLALPIHNNSTNLRSEDNLGVFYLGDDACPSGIARGNPHVLLFTPLFLLDSLS